MEPPTPPSSPVKKINKIEPEIEVSSETKTCEIKCKNCNGNHWTRMCKIIEDKKEPVVEKKMEFDLSSTIKILSLPKDINENDLYELFINRDICLEKIFIPKDYSSNEPKGIAFLTLKNKEDVNISIKIFNNLGLNNVIIKVTLAKDD